MKTSNKIMLLLALTLVGGLFLSNYKLKQQLDNINTSDPYWDYPIREVGEFHHVQIVGGNLLETQIITGDKNQVMRSEDLKDWLKAEIKNDTLYIDYAKHVPTTRTEESQTVSGIDVIITMKELHSLTGYKSNVELKVPTSEALKIIARNSSAVYLQEIAIGNSVDVLIENNSFFGIYKQDEETLKLNNLDITARHKSQMMLNNVFAKSGNIRLDPDTKITADARLLENLVVE